MNRTRTWDGRFFAQRHYFGGGWSSDCVVASTLTGVEIGRVECTRGEQQSAEFDLDGSSDAAVVLRMTRSEDYGPPPVTETHVFPVAPPIGLDAGAPPDRPGLLFEIADRPVTIARVAAAVFALRGRRRGQPTSVRLADRGRILVALDGEPEADVLDRLHVDRASILEIGSFDSQVESVNPGCGGGEIQLLVRIARTGDLPQRLEVRVDGAVRTTVDRPIGDRVSLLLPVVAPADFQKDAEARARAMREFDTVARTIGFPLPSRLRRVRV